MAFLSKILFKPNKVLEILSSVCISYVFKSQMLNVSNTTDTHAPSRQPEDHYSSLLDEDYNWRCAKELPIVHVLYRSGGPPECCS